MKTVLLAAPVHPVLSDGLKALGYDLIAGEKFSQAEMQEVLPQVTGIITSTRILLDRAALDKAVHLRWVGRMGSGMEIIDLEAAREKNIFVCSSPEGNCNAVGEHALGLLLSLLRYIPRSFEEIKNGQWLREENRGHELEGKTIGIIGYGHTGAAFARKLAGFDVNVLAYDVLANPKPTVYPYVTLVELEMLLKQADVLSFHVPLNKGTRHYFNDVLLQQIPKPFYLLNTSRGEVLESGAVVAGLRSGKILGAGLDVWEEEPLGKMKGQIRDFFTQMLSLSNVIVTPHIAGYSFEALFKMSEILLEKLKRSV